MTYTKDQIEKAVKSKNYVWFNSNTDYDVNIVGVRNKTVGQTVTNYFDDKITVSYKVNGVWQFYCWDITTDPGKKGMLEGKAVGGVARMVEGQYRGSHQIGLHQGKYKALCQKSPVKVFRDGDRDMEFDENKIVDGVYGINIHHAGDNSIYVENWSEGCQVFKRISEFNKFMEIMEQAKLAHGNSFTYTLIGSTDIV